LNSHARSGAALASSAKTAPCDRCSKFETLFVVDGKRLCVACFKLNLAVEPRRPGLERRDPGNESRGFGRRFQDGINADWSTHDPLGSSPPR